MPIIIDEEREIIRAELLGSYLEFCKTFFKLITNRDFIVSQPIGRESHHIQLARIFTELLYLQNDYEAIRIHIPPGHGKSSFVSFFVAWAYAHYPDCNFIYTSYSKDLAAKHTAFIKTVMTSAYYRYLFDVNIKHDSKAKDNFSTTLGGAVRAFGTGGAITGQDAGLPNLDRFSGAIIIDDPHKPDEVYSDTIRAKVVKNYQDTIRQRARGKNVPIIYIAQRLHEDDLAAYLNDEKDILKWKNFELPALDDADNVLYPEMMTYERLSEMRRLQPYVFYGQMQQNPIPAGGSIFKEDEFIEIDFEPELKATFITADTAETSKTYNDATVFSFWGVYEVETMGRKTGQLALHWIDCEELRIEPRELEDAFLDFWQDCMRHPMPPMLAAIEKKSTGVTLTSVLTSPDVRGLKIRDITRSRTDGSKTSRFFEMQPFIAKKLISFTRGAKHYDMCRKHMSKITANDSHKHDDIADTLYDAVKLALIDKVIYNTNVETDRSSRIAERLSKSNRERLLAGARAHAKTI